MNSATRLLPLGRGLLALALAGCGKTLTASSIPGPWPFTVDKVQIKCAGSPRCTFRTKSLKPGKVSRGALTFGIAVTAFAGVTAAIVARASTVDPKAVSDEAGRRVLAAVEAWQSEKPEGCPSLTGLADSGYLQSDARTDDAWGTRFRIACSGTSATVRSAGPDGRFGTPDDVVIGH